MIKDYEKLNNFEKELLRKTPVNIKENFQIMESLYNEAKILGIFPLKNPLEGIEIDIKIAKVVNSVSEITEKNISGS
jgi:hypothetical protein